MSSDNAKSVIQRLSNYFFTRKKEVKQPLAMSNYRFHLIIFQGTVFSPWTIRGVNHAMLALFFLGPAMPCAVPCRHGSPGSRPAQPMGIARLFRGLCRAVPLTVFILFSSFFLFLNFFVHWCTDKCTDWWINEQESFVLFRGAPIVHQWTTSA